MGGKPSVDRIQPIDSKLITRATRVLRVMTPSHLPVVMDAIQARSKQGLDANSLQAKLWTWALSEDETEPSADIYRELDQYGVTPSEMREVARQKMADNPSFESWGRTSQWLNSAFSLTHYAVQDRHCYFATEEAAALVLAGADNAIERVAATAADLPSPSGIAYFHRPAHIGGFFLLWGANADGMVQASTCSAPMLAHWLETNPKDLPKNDGIGFRVLPIRQAFLSPAGSDQPPAPVDVSGSLTMKYDSGEDPKPLTDDPLDDVNGDLAIPVLLSFTHMMRQVDLLDSVDEKVKGRTPADRKGRRRTRTDTITYLSHGPRRTGGRVEGSANRKYSHRWVVRGHWRRQWYPSQNRHIPIWITDYIAGPDDAPIVVRDKVTIARPPES